MRRLILFVLFLMIYTLVPLSIIHLIEFLNPRIDEFLQVDTYTLGSKMTWLISYYVVGMLNLIYFSSQTKILGFIFIWILGLEGIGVALVLSAFNSSNHEIVGFPIFSWDFGIWLYAVSFSLLYNLILFLVTHGHIYKRNLKQRQKL
ncbi:hypothetical protein IM700_006180 [Paenibacillus sp. DXFW5]|uniref:Uncharacterized protein n=1 Tax=Paenibacillus rhizolycopersici TaxID=2780073 RepID=A0ABS2H4E6_9BACL|nr:hypothetical protein [Paenibacillus rhizolycopersici]MBM6995248.1 hypothetical protein [Paenibacillus rhizolycopersici]